MFTKEDEEKVRDYVLKASKHGISKELILFKLKSAGFEEEDVKPIIGEILKKAPKISNPKVPVPLQKKIPLKTVILIPIFIVLILIVATIIIFFSIKNNHMRY